MNESQLSVIMIVTVSGPLSEITLFQILSQITKVNSYSTVRKLLLNNLLWKNGKSGAE